MWTEKVLRRAKIISKNNVRELALPDRQTYYELEVINSLWY